MFGYRSGVRDTNNNMRLGKNIIDDLTGSTVEAYEAMNKSCDLTVKFNGEAYSLSVWRDILRTNTAESIINYNDYGFETKSCVTKHAVGKGTVYYFGASLDRYLSKEIYKEVLCDADISYDEGLGLEHIELLYGNEKKTFRINHSFTSVDDRGPISYK